MAGTPRRREMGQQPKGRFDLTPSEITGGWLEDVRAEQRAEHLGLPSDDTAILELVDEDCAALAAAADRRIAAEDPGPVIVPNAAAEQGHGRSI